MSIEITRFRKEGGPLTKSIRLDHAGHVVSDASACLMATGEAERIQLGGITDLGALIEGFHADEALALGALRQRDLPGHRHLAMDRNSGQHRDNGRCHRNARRGAVLGRRPFRDMDTGSA
jgi:hypothetical protein